MREKLFAVIIGRRRVDIRAGVYQDGVLKVKYGFLPLSRNIVRFSVEPDHVFSGARLGGFFRKYLKNYVFIDVNGVSSVDVGNVVDGVDGVVGVDGALDTVVLDDGNVVYTKSMNLDVKKVFGGFDKIAGVSKDFRGFVAMYDYNMDNKMNEIGTKKFWAGMRVTKRDFVMICLTLLAGYGLSYFLRTVLAGFGVVVP